MSSFLNCILCIAFLTKQDSHIDCSVEMLILVVEKIMQILRVYFLSVERFPIGTDWVDQEPGLQWLKRTLLRLTESSMSSRSYWPTRPTSRAIIRYDLRITFSVCILQFKTFFVINIFLRSVFYHLQIDEYLNSNKSCFILISSVLSRKPSSLCSKNPGGTAKWNPS